MLIIGCDYHPSFQQIAWLNTDTGERGSGRLEHNAEAEAFYRGLRGKTVRVGMESTGGIGWFRQLLSECGHQLQVAHAAQVRARATRRQKTDQRDAELLLELLQDGKFEGLTEPTAEQRDRRQLLLHRHRLVQMRTRVKNQLQALAMDQGVRQKKKLWSSKGRPQLEALSLGSWAGVRRTDLLALLDDLNQRLVVLDHEVLQQAQASAQVRRLMTHPGVGPVVGLGFQLTILDPQRFATSRKLTSYLGFQSQRAQLGGQAAAGPHQQARQCAAARLAGGSGAGGGAARCGVGTAVSAAGRKEEPQPGYRGHGPQAGGAAVVDVEVRIGLRANGPVRFACRVA